MSDQESDSEIGKKMMRKSGNNESEEEEEDKKEEKKEVENQEEKEEKKEPQKENIDQAKDNKEPEKNQSNNNNKGGLPTYVPASSQSQRNENRERRREEMYNNDRGSNFRRNFDRDREAPFQRRSENDENGNRNFGARRRYVGPRFNNGYNNNYNNNYNRNDNGGNHYERPNYYNSQYNQSKVEIPKEFAEIVFLVCKSFTYLTEGEAYEAIKVIKNNPKRTAFEIMNQISSDNITKNTIHNSKRGTLSPSLFSSEIEIYETIDLEYLNQEHKKILKYYKVYEKREDSPVELEDDFYYKGEVERRRKLKKSIDGLYNYIPILCPNTNHTDEIEKESCIYSHNSNEIKYHPLIYKTSLCYGCLDDKCGNAHNLDEDFRIIYNYKNENIARLCNFLGNVLNGYEDYKKNFSDDIEKFDRKNFKTIPCLKGENCDKDTHLCFFYHNTSEMRRPEGLFRYCNIICPNILMTHSAKFSTDNCINGDFCHYCHTKYEFYYHKKNFQKCVKCSRKTRNGICEFLETCYGIHDQESIENQELEGQIEESKEKLKSIKKECKKFGCMKCGEFDEEFIYCMFNQCNHIICRNCLKKAIKKTETKCPICKAPFTKKGIFKLSFKQNEEDFKSLKSSGKIEENEEEEKAKKKKKSKKGRKESSSDEDNYDDEDDEESEEEDDSEEEEKRKRKSKKKKPRKKVESSESGSEEEEEENEEESEEESEEEKPKKKKKAKKKKNQKSKNPIISVEIEKKSNQSEDEKSNEEKEEKVSVKEMNVEEDKEEEKKKKVEEENK